MAKLETINHKVVDGLHLLILRDKNKSKVTLRHKQVYETSSGKVGHHWENLFSYTLSKTKKGRLNSFITKAPKKVMMEVASPKFPGEHNRFKEVRDWYMITGNQAKYKRTLLNVTPYTSMWVNFISEYCEKTINPKLSNISIMFASSDDESSNTPKEEADLTVRQILVNEIYRIMNLSDVPQIQSPELEEISSVLDKLIYPYSSVMKDLANYVPMMSYDAREAVILPSLEEMIEKVTYKRESNLRELIYQKMRDAPHKSTQLTKSLNLLAVTKTYFTDEQRISLLNATSSGHQLRESMLRRDGDAVSEEKWNMLRTLCKDLKSDKHDHLFDSMWQILLNYARNNSRGMSSKITKLYKVCYLENETLEQADKAVKEKAQATSYDWRSHVRVSSVIESFTYDAYELYKDPEPSSNNYSLQRYYQKLLSTPSLFPSAVRKLIPGIKKEIKMFDQISKSFHEQHIRDLQKIMKIWGKRVNIHLSDEAAKLMSEYYITLINNIQDLKIKNVKPEDKMFLMWADDMSMEMRNEVANCQQLDYENGIKPFIELSSMFRHDIIEYVKPEDIYVF